MNRKNSHIPAPSLRTFSELMASLPSPLRQSIKDLAAYHCLTRTLRDLDEAIGGHDQLVRSLQASGMAGGTEPLVLTEAQRRESRAFRRAGSIAGAIITSEEAGLEGACLALMVVIAAIDSGPTDAETFPGRQLRQVLARLIEL